MSDSAIDQPQSLLVVLLNSCRSITTHENNALKEQRVQKFFLLTRGRTGSTAVLDALNKLPSVVTVQEPFLTASNEMKLSRDLPEVPYYDQYFRSVSPLKRMLARGRILHSYLDLLEMHAGTATNGAFGLKVLSHHVEQHPGLMRQLDQREYRCLFLRRDSLREVVSGMVASTRKRYNSMENPPPAESLRLDPVQFEDLLRGAILKTEEIENSIANWKHGSMTIFYENFVANPGQFFKEICGFLDVPIVDTPETSYKKMIGDLGKEIENLDELQEIAAKYVDEQGRYVFRKD